MFKLEIRSIAATSTHCIFWSRTQLWFLHHKYIRSVWWDAWSFHSLACQHAMHPQNALSWKLMKASTAHSQECSLIHAFVECIVKCDELAKYAHAIRFAINASPQSVHTRHASSPGLSYSTDILRLWCWIIDEMRALNQRPSIGCMCAIHVMLLRWTVHVEPLHLF